MVETRQSLRRPVALTLLLALLLAPGVLTANACMSPARCVSQSYSDSSCCFGVTKNVCLAYLQTAQTSNSEAALASYDDWTLAAKPIVRQLSHQLYAARQYSASPAPPPRTLFCRLLN
jgi:hypothetical protein